MMESFDDYSLDASGIEETVPPDLSLGADHPRDYRADLGLAHAVNTALVLNRPLLLAGEPGTGKSQLAYSLAWQLANRKRRNVASAEVIKFETKSTSVGRDLYYSFDRVSHFHAEGERKNPVYHITYRGLGLALLRALPADQARDLVPPGFPLRDPVRSVVLIDEVDKAPRDFPNDLLNEIDQMYFRVTELENRQVGGTGLMPEWMKPIVVITSNSDKVLPPPFLRRCIFYDIPFPEPAELVRILARRLGAGDAETKLVQDAVEFLIGLRELLGATYRVSAPELLQWVRAMRAAGADLSKPLSSAATEAEQTFSAVVKFRDQGRKCASALRDFLGRK